MVLAPSLSMHRRYQCTVAINGMHRRYQWAPGGVNDAGHATPKSSDSFLSVVIGFASSIE